MSLLLFYFENQFQNSFIIFIIIFTNFLVHFYSIFFSILFSKPLLFRFYIAVLSSPLPITFWFFFFSFLSLFNKEKHVNITCEHTVNASIASCPYGFDPLSQCYNKSIEWTLAHTLLYWFQNTIFKCWFYPNQKMASLSGMGMVLISHFC